MFMQNGLDQGCPTFLSIVQNYEKTVKNCRTRYQLKGKTSLETRKRIPKYVTVQWMSEIRTNSDFGRSTFGPVSDGFGIPILDNNLCPKSKLVKGQMEQKVQFLDKCPKTFEIRTKLFGFRTIGPKIFWFEPKSPITKRSNFGLIWYKM